MANSETGKHTLENQVEMLRSVDTANSAGRVQDGITESTRLHRRQVFFASLGAAISIFATVYFALQGDPFGYIALGFTSGVMVWVALRSARQASTLASLKQGASLLASWRAEIRVKLRQTLVAPVLGLAFSALTGAVFLRHGALDLRPYLFLATSAGVLVFATYQLLVVRPALKRELELLGQNE